MEMELHNSLLPAPAFATGTISITTNTTTDGVSIDTAGFEALEYVVTSGTITDGVYTATLEESTTGAFAGEETVVSSELVLGAISFVLTDDNATQRIGSVGKEQFQRITIVSTGVTTGGAFSVTAVLGEAHSRPTAGA